MCKFYVITTFLTKLKFTNYINLIIITLMCEQILPAYYVKLIEHKVKINIHNFLSLRL